MNTAVEDDPTETHWILYLEESIPRSTLTSGVGLRACAYNSAAIISPNRNDFHNYRETTNARIDLKQYITT